MQTLSYCQYCNAPSDDVHHSLHKWYHDNIYGIKVVDDNELFARLILEINQAGLSWTTILRKWKTFYDAYDHFEIEKVALYDESTYLQLMENEGIIRNKLKIMAAIHNAQEILKIQQSHGSFASWLQIHQKTSPHIKEWQKIFKKQ